MKPYVESGRAAQRRLESGPVREHPSRQRLYNNLRAMKQVINTFGVAAIMLIPAFGVITGSAFIAAVTAGHFLLVICVLELFERAIKRELSALDDSA
jgi:hypothetical protein